MAAVKAPHTFKATAQISATETSAKAPTKTTVITIANRSIYSPLIFAPWAGLPGSALNFNFLLWTKFVYVHGFFDIFSY